MNIQKLFCFALICTNITFINNTLGDTPPRINAWVIDYDRKLLNVELPSGKIILSPGKVEVSTYDIAVNTSGQLYGVGSRLGTNNILYTISTEDATSIFIGALNAGRWPAAIEFRFDNILFAATHYFLYQVDTSTGKAKKVFELPYDPNWPIGGTILALAIDEKGNFYLTTDEDNLIEVQADFTSWKKVGHLKWSSIKYLVTGNGTSLYGFSILPFWGELYTINTLNASMQSIENNNFKFDIFGMRGATASPQSFSLPEGWLSVITSTPTKPTYSDGPEKLPGKENLIVVTHGWVPPWESPTDTQWLDDMTNVLTQYLVLNNKDDWQVHEHRWLEKARVPISLVPFRLGPETALFNGAQEGENLGIVLAAQKWNHIHFIGNSAGSALIQSATETIKDPVNGHRETVVHTTFLDPYVGLIYGGRNKYGHNADWSDNYFSKDSETFDNGLPTPTSGPMDHSHNVDVTWLDGNKTTLPGYFSSADGTIIRCYQTMSSHFWPHMFYLNTIPPNTQMDSKGFGFPLSKEGGGWDRAINQYRTGKDTLEVLGNPDPSCISVSDIPTLKMPVDLSKLTVTKSQTGATEINADGLKLITSSPAWAAFTIATTNTVNFISFESEFTSDAAEGLLTVYWDTNQICSIDERVTLTGYHQYSFGFPRSLTNTVHMIGFRLDQFSPVTSSVLVKNISLGSVGVVDPFSLSFRGSYDDDLPIFQLRGPAGFIYSIETSTNLVGWEPFALLVNTNGTVNFTDPDMTNSTARFYRAIAP